LVHAVQGRNLPLARLLVSKTDRVAATRALGIAIDRQDAAMATLLLTSGDGDVRCDFEVSDRPNPRHPLDDAQYCYELGEPAEFLPPLVRAVRRCSP
jgi:hypothetical protein